MNEKIIHTEYGDIVGADTPLCTRYLGIPFAKPPLGELRFRHPQKPEPWEGVLECKTSRDNPIQSPTRFEYRKHVSADCLYLNVYVPHNLKGPVPTMVWIHGGAYESGGVGASPKTEGVPVYDMSTFVNETNTIAVTLAYRMNVEGFMNLHALSDRFDSNNGLYDIKMGLEFVRDNIAAFGGDPNNVTLFGESAGGALTLAMLSSDLTKDLFHKAIVQSACVDHFWSEEKSAKIAKAFAKYCKVKKPEEIVDLPLETLRNAMRKVSKKLLMSGELTSTFSPAVDGIFLKEQPHHAVKGRTHPMLIGTITHEGDLFTLNLSPLMQHLMALMTPAKPRKEKAPFRLRAADGLTDYVFRIPAEDIANEYAGPCYLYELDCLTKAMADCGCRSFHSADLMPLFHMTTDFGDAEEPNVLVMGKLLRRIWKDFAYGTFEAEPYRVHHHKIILNPDIAREEEK